jgi:hypothetical protein
MIVLLLLLLATGTSTSSLHASVKFLNWDRKTAETSSLLGQQPGNIAVRANHQVWGLDTFFACALGRTLHLGVELR